MKEFRCVTSLLGTDLYKFNMQMVMLHKHSDLEGEYRFKCRNENVIFTPEMVKEINHQIDLLCELRFTDEEREYLRSIRFIKNDYVEMLRIWHPIRDYVNCYLDEQGKLQISVKGPMWMVMQFEIYLLEIVNEVYFRYQYNYDELVAQAKRKALEKIEAYKQGKYTFKFGDFGCRRRLSREWQEEVVKMFIDSGMCTATSNVELAKKFNVTPIGTYAHEFIQMYQGIQGIEPAYSNKYAMQDWFDEFRGDNGIALTDTITTDVFLKDFDYNLARTYNGVRHDSSDPFEWGDKIIAHYKALGIDPKTKTLLFSDSLNFDRAQKIYDYFKDKCKVAFGIGTFITNDTDVEPLNIVIKLQYVNGRPVAKLSDNPGKTMSADSNYTEYLKRCVDFRLKDGR
jgi:nicotinate phosphoribosyltransferase